MKKLMCKLNPKAIMALVITFALPAISMAGVGGQGATGQEFLDMYTMLVEWTSGYLGATLSIFAFVIGLGLGVARSNPIPAIAGVVFAMFVAYGPGIIEAVTATV